MIPPPPWVMNKPFPKGRIHHILRRVAEAAAALDAMPDALRLISGQLRVRGVIGIAEQTA